MGRVDRGMDVDGRAHLLGYVSLCLIGMAKVEFGADAEPCMISYDRHV